MQIDITEEEREFLFRMCKITKTRSQEPIYNALMEYELIKDLKVIDSLLEKLEGK